MCRENLFQGSGSCGYGGLINFTSAGEGAGDPGKSREGGPQATCWRAPAQPSPAGPGPRGARAALGGAAVLALP